MMKCPHCGKLFEDQAGLVPTHDYPVPCRQVCPGSGQYFRLEIDRRPLWKDEKKLSLERRFYNAWFSGKGIRLSATDLIELLVDDAMQTRITNAIAVEAGFEEPGAADKALWGIGGSVRKFIGRLKRAAKGEK